MLFAVLGVDPLPYGTKSTRQANDPLESRKFQKIDFFLSARSVPLFSSFHAHREVFEIEDLEVFNL